jgi:hypothetical protein
VFEFQVILKNLLHVSVKHTVFCNTIFLTKITKKKMLLFDSHHLLFIHPLGEPSQVGVVDDVTRILVAAMRKIITTGHSFPIETNKNKNNDTNPPGFLRGVSTMGVHCCTGKNCKAQSNSVDGLLLDGQTSTNTLALHYIMYHREEVPTEELNKIQRLAPLICGNTNDLSHVPDPTVKECNGWFAWPRTPHFASSNDENCTITTLPPTDVHNSISIGGIKQRKQVKNYSNRRTKK